MVDALCRACGSRESVWVGAGREAGETLGRTRQWGGGLCRVIVKLEGGRTEVVLTFVKTAYLKTTRHTGPGHCAFL